MAKQIQMSKQIQMRPCRHCGQDFTPAFKGLRAFCSAECRDTYQAESRRVAERARYAANPEESQEADRQYRQNNRERHLARRRATRLKNVEHYRAKRQAYYWAHRDQERAAYGEWQKAHRSERTAYMVNFERRKRAIDQAKADPKYQDGFSLVRTKPKDGKSFWRAVLFGIRVPPSEEVVARFVREGEEWTVHPSLILGEEARKISYQLGERERKYRTGEQHHYQRTYV